MILSKRFLVGALIVASVLYFLTDITILRVLDHKTDLIAEACSVNEGRLRHLEELAH